MKRVVIIGASGTGKCLAKRLAAKNVNVHLVGRNEEKLKEITSHLTKNVSFSVLDVLDHDKLKTTMQKIASEGEISGFVYAVGSIPLKPLKSTTAKDFLDCYNLNFLSGALAFKELAPSLLKTKGSAVFFSTVAAKVGFPNHTAIASSKGAIEAFVRSASAEMPSVRVNAVAPSLTDTPLAARMLSNETMRKALGDAHPIQRLGTEDDLASISEFLLDDNQSGWITGQIFAVDGGRSTVRPKN